MRSADRLPISSRDAGGRARRFSDSRAREFEVKYDEQQRVQSVEATLRPHISDIVSIGYAPDGSVVGVNFRTGYTVIFQSHSDGTQIIRDSHGGALRRVGGNVTHLADAQAEQSAKLSTAVTEFESLMSALGRRVR